MIANLTKAIHILQKGTHHSWLKTHKPKEISSANFEESLRDGEAAFLTKYNKI